MFLTLDVGTTAVKAGLFDNRLSPVGFAIREYQLSTYGDGIIEMTPEIYWGNAISGIKKLLLDTDVNPEEIVSVTCTTQGETIIPVDTEGNPLHNAIVWLDSRAGDEARQISAVCDATEFYSKTGVPEINAYCPLSKYLWLKNHQPEIYKRTHKLLLLEDYLVYKLTGKFVTNPAILCSTGYFNIMANAIWTEILEKFGLDEKKIPPVYPCGTPIAKIQDKVAAELGINSSVIVSTGAMDQVAAAIGSGNIVEGIVTDCTGTCQVVSATVEHPDMNSWSPITVYSHALGGKFLLITISQTAGILLKWFRNEFCGDIVAKTTGNAFDLMDELARGVPPLSKGVAVYPFFTGVQTPVSDDRARGVFFGIGLDTGRDCFIRAIMESIGYTLRESTELMRLEGRTILCLGGASKSDLWNQIKADICNVQIIAMDIEEAASLGAAILGSVASKAFASIEEAVSVLKRGKEFYARSESAKVYEKGYEKYKKMYCQFQPLFRMSMKDEPSE